MKTWQKLVIVVIAAVAFSIFLLFNALQIAPKHYNVRYETLSSDKIGTQMNGIRIVWFSDLEYGTFVDEKRLNDIVTRINDSAPDIVVFGGDLYDEEALSDSEKNTQLINALSSLKAPLGKFSVYGDNDRRNEQMLNDCTAIMKASGFEILNNSSVTLHNKGSQYVTLVGLDNGLNGTPDTAAAYSSVSRSSYVITVCHTPDYARYVPGDLTDYFLAGHSHGGQVDYFFGTIYTPDMAVEYFRGKHQVNDDFTLDITNGVGTTGTDARFLVNQEIVVYTLHSEKTEETETSAPLNTPAPTPSATPAAETETPVPEETEVPTEEPAEEEPEEEIPQEESEPEETEWEETNESEAEEPAEYEETEEYEDQ